MKKLVVFLVIYVITYCALAFKVYTDQGVIDKIMADPVYVTANVDDVTFTTKTKRGIEIKEFDIQYSFQSGGESISGIYNVPESNYNAKDFIEVVHKRYEPELNMAKLSIEGYASSGTFSEKLVKLLVFALVVALIPYALVALSLGWMKVK